MITMFVFWEILWDMYGSSFIILPIMILLITSLLMYRRYTSNVNENYEMIKVEKAKKLRIGPNIYPMTAVVRGYCIIINNYEFDDPQCPKRTGSEIDTNRLRQVFRQLNFAIVLYNNLTAERIHEILDYHSSGSELASHDALAVLILSHGTLDNNEDMICGTDYKIKDKKISGGITVKEIIEKFNNIKCPNLRGKPKMFFFNCCRVKKIGFVQTDATLSKKNPAEWGDVFIFNATFSGNMAWRDPNEGAYFCRALAQAIIKHAWNLSLSDIFLEVNRLIREDERFRGKILHEGRIKEVVQVPTTELIGCTKNLYFNPGLSNSAPVKLEENSIQILAKTSTFIIKKVILFRDTNILFGLTSRSLGYFGPHFIVAIEPESPASECGIKVGDIIFEVNGQWAFYDKKIFNSFIPPREMGEKIEIILVECDGLILDNAKIKEFKEKAQTFLKTFRNYLFDSITKTGIFNAEYMELANVIVQKLILSDLLFLVRGKDRSKSAWHYVLVEEDKLESFRTASKRGRVDVADYGKILKSGWGDDPPPHVENELSHILRMMIGLQQYKEQG